MSDPVLVEVGQGLFLPCRTYTHHGVVHRTFELPEATVRKLGLHRIKSLIEVHQRGLQRIDRQAEVLRLLRSGMVAKRVAHKVGLSDAQVYRIGMAGVPGARTLGIKTLKLSPKE